MEKWRRLHFSEHVGAPRREFSNENLPSYPNSQNRGALYAIGAFDAKF
jgi:hypothetical protein